MGKVRNMTCTQAPPASVPVVNIMGVHIAALDMPRLVRYISDASSSGIRTGYFCAANVHTTVTAYEDSGYRAILNNSLLTFPDGGPIAALGRKRGFPEMQRTAGPDLLREILSVSAEHGWRHFFYGSTTETLSLMEKNIKNNFPDAVITGMISPPFRPLSTQEDEAFIQQINAAEPDFIWVGLGAPKQERWMAEHQGSVSGLMFGVGAAFDLLAGNYKRAPLWMREHNLEWAYRLLQEPKRLFSRYFFTNLKFILEAVIKGK